jgi:excisionase family DNA binding protein
MAEQQLLTPQQLAERWQCHPRTVRKLAELGKLRGLRVGDLWRFKLADVEAFESANANTAPAAPEKAAAERAARSTHQPASDFALPDGYEPIFPEAWGREPTTGKRPASRRGATTRERPTPRRN